MPTNFISNRLLLTLLEQATEVERESLTKLAAPLATSTLQAEPLANAISTAGGHGLANWARSGRGTSYTDILDDIAIDLKIKEIPRYNGAPIYKGMRLWRLDSVRQMQTAITEGKVTSAELLDLNAAHIAMAESKIMARVLEQAYTNMTPEQKMKFDANVADVIKQYGGDKSKGLFGTAGLLVLGNLGGFATYTLMSTVLSSLSFGLLGFGAYTAASSLMAVVLGPAGWIALSGAAVYKLGKPGLKVTIPLVMNIGMIRLRLRSEGFRW